MASSSTGKGKGRQKIKMEKMENESNLQVTFSKRRNGVFKKAHELSILTGAEVAAIVFSPGGKVYSFGHPDIEAVTERFLTGTPPPQTPSQQLVQVQRSKNVVKINAKLDKVKDMLEYERNRGAALEKALSEGQCQRWVTADVDEQNLAQLQLSTLALKNTQADFEREINARAARQQIFGAPAGGYSYYGGERGFPALMRPMYDGNESGSSLAVVQHPIGHAGTGGSGGGEDGRFFMGPGGYGGGGGGSGVVLPGSASVGFYGNSGGEPFFGGSSSLAGAGGGGNGSGSSLAVVQHPIGHAGIGGGGRFFMGQGGYGGGDGGSGLVLPGSASVGFYGNSSGGPFFGSSSSLAGACAGAGAGGQFFAGPSSLAAGGGGSDGGQFFAGPSSFTGGSGGGFLNRHGASSVGNSVGGLSFGDGPSSFTGGGPFTAGPSSFVGGSSCDGMPNTDGASSFGAESGGSGSTSRDLEWDGSIPPSGFGGRV